MAIKHIEYALSAIVTALKAHMQTELTTIQTEMGDGVTLTAPVTDGYYIHELGAIDIMPAIQVIANRTEVLTPGGTWNDVDHKIIIVCHVISQEGKEEYCAKRAMRFARAVNEIILDHRTIDGTYINWYVDSVDYKPMMTDGNCLKQEVWLNCTVKIIES